MKFAFLAGLLLIPAGRAAFGQANDENNQLIEHVKHLLNGRIDRSLPAPERFSDWLHRIVPDEKIHWGTVHCGQINTGEDEEGNAVYDQRVCVSVDVDLPAQALFSAWIEVGTEEQGINDANLGVRRSVLVRPGHAGEEIKIGTLPDLVKPPAP